MFRVTKSKTVATLALAVSAFPSAAYAITDYPRDGSRGTDRQSQDLRSADALDASIRAEARQTSEAGSPDPRVNRHLHQDEVESVLVGLAEWLQVPQSKDETLRLRSLAREQDGSRHDVGKVDDRAGARPARAAGNGMGRCVQLRRSTAPASVWSWRTFERPHR
jgi:hypothetical protein